jgi:signal transduction histidine kinase
VANRAAMSAETEPTPGTRGTGRAPIPPGERVAPTVPRGSSIRRIMIIGAIVPIAYIWLFEVVRFAVVDRTFNTDLAHLLSAAFLGLSVVAFAIFMLRLMERAQREVMRQNRELETVNAIHEAVDGARAPDEILDRALGTMIEKAGAVSAEATTDEAHDGLRRQRGDVAVADGNGRRLDTVDVPLAVGPTSLGHLRLYFASDHRGPRVLSDAALASIGAQVATALELSRNVRDLERREREANALYDIALRLTSKGDLADLLNGILADAETLLDSEQAVACLALGDSGYRTRGGWADRLALLPGGSLCSFAHAKHDSLSHDANPLCPLRPRGDGVCWLSVPLRTAGEPLGELCVSRTNGVEYTPRDHDLLAALADLTSIAISTSRMREVDEQWTILRERERIAREMHDSIAQVLGVLHLRLRHLQPAAERGDSTTVSRTIAELADLADESYRDVREAILGLRESPGAGAGLVDVLQEYLEKFGRQSSIRTKLVVEGHDLPALSPPNEVQVLRVVQEALTNVRKHAGASEAVVRIELLEDETVISVEDDGTGFDPSRITDALEGGFGLQSMRERIEQIGGTLEIRTAPGQGTGVIGRLPRLGIGEVARNGTVTAHAPAPG